MKPKQRLFQITSRALFTFFALLFVAFLLWLSFGYPPRARYVPQVVAIFSIVCLAIQWALDSSPVLQNLVSKVEKEETFAGEDQVKQARASDAPDFRLELISYLWLVVLLVSLLLFGFLISIPLYMIFYLRFQAQISWLKSGLYGVATWLFVYFLFVRLFEIRLYAGFLIEPFLD